MEYLLFLSVVLLVLGLCGLLLHYGGRRKAKGIRAGADNGRSAANDLHALRRRIGKRSEQATPWGWPGGTVGGPVANRDRWGEGLPMTLGRWVDSLVVQKRTVDDDPDYRIRTHASIRALVEDRYGRQTTRPRDSEGSSNAANDPASTRAVSSEPRVRPGAQGIKTPWGW